jgi:hypothetical protein
MKFLNYLQEEYETSVKVRGEQVPIFINPNNKEMREIGKESRFIIDPISQKFYIWNANKALHDSIIKKLNLNLKILIIGQGEGDKSNYIITEIIKRGKISKKDSESIKTTWLNDIFKNLNIKHGNLL